MAWVTNKYGNSEWVVDAADRTSDSDLFNTGRSYRQRGLAESFLPGQGAKSPNIFQQGINSLFGSTYGYNTGIGKNNMIGYVDASGNQMYTGDLSNNQEALNYFKENPTVLDTGNSAAGGLAGLLSGIGGAKGFADLAGGLGALGSLYTGYKQNKMAEQEHNARMGELSRQRQRDADWERDIKASGLGTYSAGMGGK